MNLQAAASIGMGLIKHRQEIGEGLTGLASLAGGAGKLAGAGFSKIADKFNLDELANKVGDALNTEKPGESSLQSLSYMNHFDVDANGILTREELTNGLKKLEESGLAATSGAAQKIHNFGTNLLAHYEKAAALDGASGFSARDLGLLANQDRQMARISADDWNRLNA